MTDFRDLRSPTEKSPRDDRPNGNIERDWWNKSGKDCAGAIKSTVEMLMQAQTARMRQQVINSRLYGAQSTSPALGTAYSRASSTTSTASGTRLTYNGVQENIDTQVARTGETKARPYFLTNGGNYKQQRKAKKLNQFIEGDFYETKAYDVGLEAFRDGLIQGDGFVFCFARGGKLQKERVWGSELWVDEVEAQYGFPRNLHRVKVADRGAVLTLAKSEADKTAILDANRAVEPGTSRSVADMITVVESWHLPSMNDEGELVGGKHCVSIEDYMLEEPEEWPSDFFPFARFSWCKRPMGYWSQSLAEQLQPSQMELNKNLFYIQRSMHLAGSFKLLLHNGSKVVQEAVNNEIGATIKWAGSVKPEYITVSPIDRVFWENSQVLIERMRDLSGNSKMQTTGTKPAGELSGKALREIEQVGDERHRSEQRANDNFYMQMAAIDICLANEMAKNGEMKPVRVPGKTSFRTIDWKKDIEDVPTDSYVMQCFPVSRLPKDPAGRLATIQEYIQAGFMTPRQGRRALDFPDLDTVESLANAQEDMISLTLDNIIDDGEYAPPEPTDDLVLAKEMCLEYIQKYRALDLEEEKLDMLRTFNSQIDAMLEKGAQIQAQQQAALAPQAAPMPPPQSQLIPNAPGVA